MCIKSRCPKCDTLKVNAHEEKCVDKRILIIMEESHLKVKTMEFGLKFQ